MQELIYKQEAHDKLKSMYLKIEAERGHNDVANGLRIACKAIGEIKEVDTEPVRHGQLDEDKPLTNGDRIRAMTDEELSVFLGGIADNCSYNTCDNCPMYGACVDVQLSRDKWLRQEAVRR